MHQKKNNINLPCNNMQERSVMCSLHKQVLLLFEWLICVILIILDCELDNEAYEDGSEIPTIDCNTW